MYRNIKLHLILLLGPGVVAQSEASRLGMQAAPSSIPTSGIFFRGDLVMKTISTTILPLPLIQEEQLSVTGERMCTKYWYTAKEACLGTMWLG